MGPCLPAENGVRRSKGGTGLWLPQVRAGFAAWCFELSLAVPGADVPVPTGCERSSLVDELSFGCRRFVRGSRPQAG
jgi:hypothetical protein